MKKIMVTAATTLALLVVPQVAHAHPGHASCRGYGQLIAAEAREGIIADEIGSYEPGAVDDVVRLVHLGGSFDGMEVPSFCAQ